MANDLRTILMHQIPFPDPMYVLPCKVFLNMEIDTMFAHQELLEKEDLVEWSKESKGPVALISHQWLGFQHPDPDFCQMKVLQDFMLKVLSNEIKSVDPTWVTAMFFDDEDRVGHAML